MEPKGKFDYERLKLKTLEQLHSGKSLFGKDGAFAPLLKDTVVSSPKLLIPDECFPLIPFDSFPSLYELLINCKLPLKLARMN